MDGKTDDTAAIILQRISTAIEKTCDKRSMRPGLAANEAAAYLKKKLAAQSRYFNAE